METKTVKACTVCGKAIKRGPLEIRAYPKLTTAIYGVPPVCYAHDKCKGDFADAIAKRYGYKEAASDGSY